MHTRRTNVLPCTVTLALLCCIAACLPINPVSEEVGLLSEQETIHAYLANGGHERIKKALNLPEEVYYNPLAHFSRDDAPVSPGDDPKSSAVSDIDILRSLGYYLPGLDDESMLHNGHVHRMHTVSRQSSLSSDVRGAKSVYTIEYFGNPPDGARTAFEHALGMWADQFECQVPLRVLFKWEPIRGQTLALANSPFIIRGRSSSSKLRSDTAYTPTMASAIGGRDFLPSRPHIEISFNSLIPWHYDLNRKAPREKFDLATVALHEQCHGLFFSGALLGEKSGEAKFASLDNTPGRFDQFIQTSSGVGIARSCNPRELYQAITTPGLRIRTTIGDSSFGLYAPSKYVTGSSTYHFDGFLLKQDCKRFSISPDDCSDLMTFELKHGYTRRNIGEPALRVMRTVRGQNSGVKSSAKCDIPPPVEGSSPRAGALGFDENVKQFNLPPWVVITVASVGAVGAVIVLAFITSAIIN